MSKILSDEKFCPIFQNKSQAKIGQNCRNFGLVSKFLSDDIICSTNILSDEILPDKVYYSKCLGYIMISMRIWILEIIGFEVDMMISKITKLFNYLRIEHEVETFWFLRVMLCVPIVRHGNFAQISKDQSWNQSPIKRSDKNEILLIKVLLFDHLHYISWLSISDFPVILDLNITRTRSWFQIRDTVEGRGPTMGKVTIKHK